ncbi:MAG: glycogen/starch synthase [Muribaculaceae bacterium]|nr:glycogen/starch synthase [Muribaculaceae bacterium]
MMDVNKVLFISQEIAPYLADSELSLFGRDLPQAIQEAGVEVRTFMPRYGIINERRNQLHEVIRLSGLNIVIDDTDHPLIIKVATLQPSRMQVYFIDNDDYFLRHTSDGLETDIMAADNDERIIFFVRGVVETVKKLRWEPSIIHCTGWVTALTPLLLKRIYADDPSFANTRIVYSLYDKNFDGTLDPRMAEKLRMDGFSDEDITSLLGSDVDSKMLNKIAIDYADAVIQSSPVIDPELIDYAKKSGKPFLPYSGDENIAEAYLEFYRSL